ncbi:MAG: hypothetical protein HON55_00580 [Legionellales bacterium]|nr:hypothetical protein [Legionellales bacterium]
MPLSEKSIQAAIQNCNFYSLCLDSFDAPIIYLDGIVNDQIPNANDEKKSYEILLNDIFKGDNVLEAAATYKHNNPEELKNLPYLMDILDLLEKDIETKKGLGAPTEAAAIRQVKNDYIERQKQAEQNTKSLFDNEDLYKDELKKLESKDLYGIAVTDDNGLPSWPDINKTAIDIYFHEKLLSSILEVKAEITTNKALKESLLNPIISDISRQFKDTLDGKDLLPKDLGEEKLLSIKQHLIDKLATNKLTTKITPNTNVTLKDLFQANAYIQIQAKNKHPKNDEHAKDSEIIQAEFAASFQLVKNRYDKKYDESTLKNKLYENPTKLTLEEYIYGRIEKKSKAVIESFSGSLAESIGKMKGEQLVSKEAEDKPTIFSAKNISAALAITLCAVLIGLSVATLIPAAVALSLGIVGAVTIGVSAIIRAHKSNDQYKPTDPEVTTPNPLHNDAQTEVKGTPSTSFIVEKTMYEKVSESENNDDNQGASTNPPKPGK